jgi:hypothetical protein
MWKMVPCLLWCLWREQNDRNFEDQEMTLEEIKTFYTLFTWTTAYLAPLVLSYNEFLVFFSFLIRRFSYILPVH